jgi:hypothetical protein
MSNSTGEIVVLLLVLFQHLAITNKRFCVPKLTEVVVMHSQLGSFTKLN